MRDRVERAVPVFFERLALPGEHRHAGRGDGGGGVVLRREDVAATPSARRRRASTSVSISTAVWMVMCSEPVTRTPLSGFGGAYLPRMDIRPGISCSAMSISLRPQSASEMSRDLVILAMACS